MAKQEYSKAQKKIIDRYYEHFDTIMLTKLQELVGELYLAESKKKQDQLWERIRKAMINMQVPAEIMNHILEKRSPMILAKNLEDWLKAANSR